MNYYNKTVDAVISELQTSEEKGLSSNEVQNRQAKYGYNEFEKKGKTSFLQKFFSQFKSFMIVVLIIAAFISGIVGFLEGEGFTDAIIILFIVILNAIIGTLQESKAEKSLDALEKMSAPHSTVIRNGQAEVIPAKELVPGDVIILETGDLVPADLRLFRSVNLKIQEAALTGESLPVEKEITEIVETDVPLGDRHNLAFSSCLVTYGRGRGIVVGTGMNTEVGKIASMIQAVPNSKTPLQEKLDKLGKFLGIAALIICALLFVVGLLYGKGVMEMFMIAVSLAAAAIPEGLPAVSTIVLAVGVQRLAKKNAIVRTLPSVETLGSTSVICSDKTGTLTQNKMTVVKLFTDNDFTEIKMLTEAQLSETQKQLISIAVFANDATLSENGNGEHTTTGDPTETALIDLGFKYHYNKNELKKIGKRMGEVPFDSERKLMTTINQINGSYQINTKGAADELLKRCNKILVNGSIIDFTDELKEIIRKANLSMAESALRVLGMAYKPCGVVPSEMTSEKVEQDMIFVGMLGMIDPPRPEVKLAVENCRAAGIKPVMITGDHKITAVAIANELGIIKEGDNAITGDELEKMSEEELTQNIDKISVYARVAPEHKVRIVKSFQESGRIVAMTGDGVNDAPALKLADIGCAMGITGTDVSKEAANIVLADDNFATIVSAVEEGRRIYDNILKAIQFMLSTNIGEIIVLFIAILANWGTPLLPIHILWINLVTDSLPALALSVDPAKSDIMQRSPIDAKQGIMNKSFSIRIFLQGCIIGTLSLIAFHIGKQTNLDVAQTMTFAVLAFAQLSHVFNVRSTHRSAFKSLFSNKLLWGAIIIVASLMFAVLEIPFLQPIFHISTLTSEQWIWVAVLSIAPLPIMEMVKGIYRLYFKLKGMPIHS